MKILLKFTIVSAWLLFAAALWQVRQAPSTHVAGRSLPISDLLSISRKITDTQAATPSLPNVQAIDWSAPDLYLVLPITDF